jgi:oligopeptidase B
MEAMQKYSPYNLISTASVIPNTLISCGLEDPRVPYWEPMKFVAKLRHHKHQTGLVGNKLLLRIGTSGHFGANEDAEMAEWITFVLSNT